MTSNWTHLKPFPEFLHQIKSINYEMQHKGSFIRKSLNVKCPHFQEIHNLAVYEKFP